MIEVPFKIQGKKAKFVPFIIDTIKKSKIDFESFVEPFFGSGVVGFNIMEAFPNTKNFVFSDINFLVVSFYGLINGLDTEYIQKRLSEHAERLRTNGADYYYEVRDKVNSAASSARKGNVDFAVADTLIDFLFLNRTSFNGLMRFNKDGLFNVPFCKNENRLTDKLINEIVKAINKIKELRLKHVDGLRFSDAPYNELLKDIPSNALIYCDPPYIKRNVNYVNNNWTIEDEIKLRDTLIETNSKFMVSNWLADSKGNINENVKNVWGEFNIKYAPSHKYIVGPTSDERPQITEILITNF